MADTGGELALPVGQAADHTGHHGGDVELDTRKRIPAGIVDEVHADLDRVS